MSLRLLLFIVLFCAALYINCIGGEFIWDDQSFVFDNAAIRSLSNLPYFFTDNKTGAATTELSSDVYRPLTTLSYAIDYFIWKVNSFGYHLTNILLHSANSILVFLLFLLILDNFFIAFFTCLLFASHPVQTEVVAWISGRSSALFLLFYLSSLICYIKSLKENKREYYFLSLFLFALSLFSKEMSVTLPLVLIIYDVHFYRGDSLKKKVLRYVPYFLLALFYISTRILLIKKVGQFEGWGNGYWTFLTMCNVVTDYIRILVFPMKLCAVGYPIPVDNSIKDPRVIFSLISLLAILASTPFLFKRNKVVSFAVLWFFITLLPALNIVPIKALEAERFLYLPSIGFCLLVAFIMSILRQKYDKPVIGNISIAILLSIFIIFAYSMRTSLRNEDWKDEIRISKKTIEANPSGAWGLTALGTNLIERCHYAEALAPLKKAVELSPDYELAHNALGECYVRLGKYEEAVPQLLEVLKTNPNSIMARNMLGVAYANLKKYGDSEKQFMAAIKKDPKFLNAHLNLGRLYEMRSEFVKAVKQYFIILENTFDPADTAVVYIRIGDGYFKMHSREKAKFYYLKAHDAGKDHELIDKVVEDKLKAL